MILKIIKIRLFSLEHVKSYFEAIISAGANFASSPLEF